jgi:WD40 repeat protein
VVRGVAFTPDSRHVLSTADGFNQGKDLILWDLDKGVVDRSLEGHKGALFPVAISRDGKRALSGGYDGIVAVWDLDQGKIIRRFTDHASPLNTVSFSRDARIAASASGWGRPPHVAYVWEVDTGKVLLRLDDMSIAEIHPSGAAVLGFKLQSKEARMWSIPEGKELFTLSGHRGELTRVAISADGRFAATGSTDQTIRVWRLPPMTAEAVPGPATPGWVSLFNGKDLTGWKTHTKPPRAHSAIHSHPIER